LPASQAANGLEFPGRAGGELKGLESQPVAVEQGGIGHGCLACGRVILARRQTRFAEQPEEAVGARQGERAGGVDVAAFGRTDGEGNQLGVAKTDGAGVEIAAFRPEQAVEQGRPASARAGQSDGGWRP
jgi:hypothetical protein